MYDKKNKVQSTKEGILDGCKHWQNKIEVMEPHKLKKWKVSERLYGATYKNTMLKLIGKNKRG